MAITGITDTKTQVQNSLYNSKAQRSANKDLDKNAFLYILTTELGNQDPTNAKDNTEYVAQLAQFSSLEQMQNLNTSMAKLLLNDKIGQGTLLVGHEVTFNTGKTAPLVHEDMSVTDEPVLFKGIVKSARVENGEVKLVTYDKNNKEYTYILDNVVEVGDYQYVDTSGNQSKTSTTGSQTTDTTGTTAGDKTTQPTTEQTQGAGQ